MKCGYGESGFGWMDGVEVVLNNRGITVEAVWQCTKDRNQQRPYVYDRVSHGHFCLVPVVVGLPSSSLVTYHLERGRMPLHDILG